MIWASSSFRGRWPKKHKLEAREVLELPPNHLVHHPRVGLDNLDDLSGDVLVSVVRDGNAVVASLVHLHRRIHRLEQGLLVNTGQDEACLVQRFGPFR